MYKELTLLFTLIAFSSCVKDKAISEVQIFGVPYEVQTLTEIDGLRDGPDYAGATIYYPVGAEPPFASIVMVPGWNSPESAIQEWGPFFASHGIVAMTIGTNNPSEDQPDDRAEALLDAIKTLRYENQRNGSPLKGKFDPDQVAVGGWSMGGGGAQLAAVLDPSLKAVVALCPWLDPKTLSDQHLDHPVPVLFICGQWDFLAPPNQHADVHYSYTPGSTDKLLYEVYHGGHDVANGPDHLCGGISYANGEIGQVALSWLNVYLCGDSSSRPSLFNIPGSASRYVTNLSE